jgi:hypothetical protein
MLLGGLAVGAARSRVATSISRARAIKRYVKSRGKKFKELRKNHWENEFNVKNEAKNEGNKMKVLNKKAKGDCL